MINIGDLLGDYSKIKNPQEDKKSVVDAVKNQTGLDIDETHVFFRKNTIILKVNPVQKNFIYIRKEQILKIIKETIPNRFVDSIGF
jgi:hypothetical protein